MSLDLMSNGDVEEITQMEQFFDFDMLMEMINHASPDKDAAVRAEEQSMSPLVQSSDFNTTSYYQRSEEETAPSSSISSTFYPGAVINRDVHTLATDLIIMSEDCVCFYVQSSRLMSASNNVFNGLLSASAEIFSVDSVKHAYVDEPSIVLNIVLHAVYDMSCVYLSPNCPQLTAAISAMHKYGLRLNHHVAPSKPLFKILLSRAADAPLEIFSLAASYGLEELAVKTSHLLLPLSLQSINDQCALRIGPIYLKRLFLLHLERKDALRKLLIQTPDTHRTTSECDLLQQSSLTRAWTLAAAFLLLEVRADMETMTIERTLRSLRDQMNCSLCRATLEKRLREVVRGWDAVKETI